MTTDWYLYIQLANNTALELQYIQNWFFFLTKKLKEHTQRSRCRLYSRVGQVESTVDWRELASSSSLRSHL